MNASKSFIEKAVEFLVFMAVGAFVLSVVMIVWNEYREPNSGLYRIEGFERGRVTVSKYVAGKPVTVGDHQVYDPKYVFVPESKTFSKKNVYGTVGDYVVKDAHPGDSMQVMINDYPKHKFKNAREHWELYRWIKKLD